MVLMGPLACFAAGWSIAIYCLVLRRTPYGRFRGRRFVTFLEVLYRGALVAASIVVLILQVAMLLTQPPVVAAASLVAAAAGAFVVYCFRRLIAGP